MKPSRIVLALIITSAILLILYNPTRRTSVRTDDTAFYHNLSLNHKSVQIIKESQGTITLEIDITGGQLPDGLDFALYYRPKSIPGFEGEISFTQMPMTQANLESQKYFVLLENPGLGSAIEYYMQLEDNSGSVVSSLRPVSSYYSVHVEGESSELSRGAHILAMFLQILFLVLVLLTSMENLHNYESNNRLGKQCLWLTIFLFVGMFPLGIWLDHQTSGHLWNGIPLGRDITQTAAMIVFIYWLILTILMKGTAFSSEPSKNILKPIGMRICTILGFLITVGLFLIPHSLGEF
jgi:hypothetical protein